jgi:ABC-2 type transport system permease protein
MNRLALLTKVQIRNSLVINGKKSKAGSRSVSFVYLIMALYSLFTAYNSAQTGLNMLASLAFLSVMIGSLFSFEGKLIGFADYDFLMSLPFTNREIIAGKLISYLFSEYLLSGAFFLPGAIYYASVSGHTLYRVFLILFGFLFLPFAGVFIGAVCGYFLMKATGGKKHQKLIRQIFSIAVIFLLWFSLVYLLQIFIGLRLPLLEWYLDGIVELNFRKVCLFALISAVMLLLLVLFYSHILPQMHDLSRQTYHDTSFQLHAKPTNSPMKALWKKEKRRFFGNSLYFLNFGIGSLIVIGISVYGVYNCFQRSPHFQPWPSGIGFLIAYVAAFFCSMSNPTAVSLLLEGKSLWLLKVIPVRPEDILHVKMKLNRLMYAVPSICIMAVSLFYVDYAPADLILCIVFLMCGGWFNSLFAMETGIVLCRLKWDSETEVLKQSAASLVGTFGPLAVNAILAFLSLYRVNEGASVRTMTAVCAGIYAVLGMLMRHRLKTKGIRIFQEMI